VSTLLRTAALRRRLPPAPAPAINQEAWGRLGKLLGGLSTVACAARSGQVVEWTDAEAQALVSVYREVANLRSELLGAKRADTAPEDKLSPESESTAPDWDSWGGSW
jgi:hypothetical protein